MTNRQNRNNRHNSNQEATEVLDRGRREVSVSTARYQHSGPIPDPMTLERYEQVLPGSAERILKMAEGQSEHRKDLERIVIESRSRDSLLGIIAAFILALVTIGAGTTIIIKGFVWSGTIIGSTGLVGLVGVFIYGTSSARKERLSQNQ